MAKGSVFVPRIAGSQDDILREQFERTVGSDDCVPFVGLGATQYVVFNLVSLTVYAITIARIFNIAPANGMVLRFPAIPPEVLSLMGVNRSGLVMTSAISILRR